MSKVPKMTAALRKEKLAGVSARREIDIALKRDHVISTESDSAKEARRDVEESLRAAPAPDVAAKTLPKVTLYAHQDVLKAIRRLAVDDGVQAQEILRRAVRDYLATRGHHFTDLTTGR